MDTPNFRHLCHQFRFGLSPIESAGQIDGLSVYVDYAFRHLVCDDFQGFQSIKAKLCRVDSVHMYASISYTAFKFTAPKELSRELFTGAKRFPTEFRQEAITFPIKSVLRRNGRMMLCLVGMSLPLFFSCYVIDRCFGSKNDVANTFALIFGMAGSGCLMSGVVSFLSFLEYASTRRNFWRNVIKAINDSATYTEFVIVARERRLFTKGDKASMATEKCGRTQDGDGGPSHALNS
jgi:hypothetical protein